MKVAKHEQERSLVALRLAILLAAVLPTVFFAAAAWFGYSDSVATAESKLDEVARTAEEHAARVMAQNEVVIQQMLRVLKDDDDKALRDREGEVREVAMAILLRLPHIHSLSVWGAEGRLLVSTLFYPAPRYLQRADWEYFGWGHAGAPATATRGWITDWSSGEPVLKLVRRRELPFGVPGGVVELTLSRSYFDDLYRRLTEGEKAMSVTLVSREGVLLGGWPRTRASGGRLPRGSRLLQRIEGGELTGTVSGSAFIPDDERHSAFRRVGESLYVVASQDTDAVLADWKRHMIVLAAITLPTTLALVFALWLGLWRTRREMETRQRLQEESEQRLRAEDALRHAQKLDALGRLAGGVAHDFNNLLMVVSANAELLAHVVPHAANRRELAAIQHAVEGGSRLTRRLLTFSRRQALNPEVLRLESALGMILDILRTAVGKGIAIDLQIDPDTPSVEVDASELELALINLVANARDAMSHAGRIAIQARRARPGEGPQNHPVGYVVISVSDSGHGMSEEVRSRVFEPFFTTKPAGSGTGLGLSQVYGFCTQAGGTVEISSELGFGTTVSLFLPATIKPPRIADAAIQPSARLH